MRWPWLPIEINKYAFLYSNEIDEHIFCFFKNFILYYRQNYDCVNFQSSCIIFISDPPVDHIAADGQQ